MFSSSCNALSQQTLKQWLDENRAVVLVDVRNEDDLSRSKIEGKNNLTFVHIPYEKLLKEGRSSNPLKASQLYFSSHKLPKDAQVVVVCWRGICSQRITLGLQEIGVKAYSLEDGMEGWRALYDTKKVVDTPALKVFQISRPARGCLSYLVTSQGEGVFIDPSNDTLYYEKLFRGEGVKLVGIIDTHCHADHISGGPHFAHKLNIPYFLHPYDAIHPSAFLPATFEYQWLQNESSIKVGASTLRVMHVPGHTLGEVALVLNESILFAGDALFFKGIARPDLGGKAEEWTPLYYNSLQKLLALPDETLVLPGHFASITEANAQNAFVTPLGILKTHNEGLLMAQKHLETFMSYIMNSLPHSPPEYSEIKKINLGLVQVSEARAKELEEGKNLCALCS